jgi:hypothetical protein
MRHAQPACGIDIQRGELRRQGRMQQGQLGSRFLAQRLCQQAVLPFLQGRIGLACALPRPGGGAGWRWRGAARKDCKGDRR